MVGVLVEKRSTCRLVERRERCQRVRLREAVLAAERVSPNEGRQVRPAAGHESLGGEDALVRSVGPVCPALLRMGEVARVAVLHAHVVEALELESFVRDHLRVWIVAEQVDVRYADWWHGRRGFLHLQRHVTTLWFLGTRRRPRRHGLIEVVQVLIYPRRRLWHAVKSPSCRFCDRTAVHYGRKAPAPDPAYAIAHCSALRIVINNAGRRAHVIRHTSYDACARHSIERNRCYVGRCFVLRKRQ